MKSISYISRFIQSISPTTIVKREKAYSSNMFDDVIYVGNNLYDEQQDDLVPYLYIDMGFDYTPYCSKETWSLLHELGHIMSVKDKSYDEKLVLFTVYNLEITKILNNEKSLYAKVYNYMHLDLEYNASKWAYNWLINNKRKVRRFENGTL